MYHDGTWKCHPRLFAEVAVAMLEQPEDQKLETRLVLVAKDVLGPRKSSERLYAGEQRGPRWPALWLRGGPERPDAKLHLTPAYRSRR